MVIIYLAIHHGSFHQKTDSPMNSSQFANTDKRKIVFFADSLCWVCRLCALANRSVDESNSKRNDRLLFLVTFRSKMLEINKCVDTSTNPI